VLSSTPSTVVIAIVPTTSTRRNPGRPSPY
jgi:hypothetical protein